MTDAPVILLSSDLEARGVEFQDLSLSLSLNYARAVLAAGGLPMVMPATVSRAAIAACVRRADGVLLTGGNDMDPRLSAPRAPAHLRRRATPTPDGGRRDLQELMLIAEVFRQRKPLLAICRGQQVLNVALGGTLWLDIPSQCPAALRHRCPERKSQIVHDVQLTPESLLHRIMGAQVVGVNSTHHQAVDRVARPLCVVARSRDGIVEGLELAGAHRGCLPFLVSVQFHPERLADRYPPHRAIFRAFVRACAANRDSAL